MIKAIYSHLREGAIVIGLTGVVGSGCTESALFLSSDLDEGIFSEFKGLIESDLGSSFDSLERYRLRKIGYFYNKNKWKKFFHLKM